MENRNKISNKNQIQHLVQLMEKHPQTARGIGQFGSSRQQMTDMWVGFAAELNGLGPPYRSAPEWQRVWVHYKANLKRKLAKNRSNLTATGGGPLQELSLSPTEERVYALTHINKSINPDGHVLGAIDVVEEDVVTSENTHIDTTTPIDMCTPTNTRTPTQRKNKVAAAETARLELLTDQTSKQAELVTILKSIEKYQYKRYELKKKQVQLLEEANKLKIKRAELLAKSLEQDNELRQVKLEAAKIKLARLQEYSI